MLEIKRNKERGTFAIIDLDTNQVTYVSPNYTYSKTYQLESKTVARKFAIANTTSNRDWEIERIEVSARDPQMLRVIGTNNCSSDTINRKFDWNMHTKAKYFCERYFLASDYSISYDAAKLISERAPDLMDKLIENSKESTQ